MRAETIRAEELRVGMTVYFSPETAPADVGDNRKVIGDAVAGTVAAIYPEKRYFVVERHAPGGTYKTCFKF